MCEHLNVIGDLCYQLFAAGLANLTSKRFHAMIFVKLQFITHDFGFPLA